MIAANWCSDTLFQMCKLNLKPENFESLENPMEQYTSTLHIISGKKTIPKPPTNPKRLNKHIGGMKNAKMLFVPEQKHW